MASKLANTNRRSALLDGSPSSSRELSSNDKNTKSSKNNSKSTSKDHEDKSRKRKKKQHKSKRDDSKEKSSSAPPVEEKIAPPASAPSFSLYDELDETISSSNAVVKTDLSLSHSPPPVIPTILRQNSRTRMSATEQMIPSSVLRSQKQNETKQSPTEKIQIEDPATKKFEEQLALLDAKSSTLTMNNWDGTSGSEEDEQIERICRMNNTKIISGPIQFKFNKTQSLPLKTSPASNDLLNNDDQTPVDSQPTKKQRVNEPDHNMDQSTNSTNTNNDENTNQNVEKTTENLSTNEDSLKVDSNPIEQTNNKDSSKIDEPVASSNTEKNSNDQPKDDRRSRSSSGSSSRRGGRRRDRRKSSYRRHRRRHRRHSSSSSSRSSYTSSSSDSSRSSSSRSRSSRSSSRSSSSSRDRRRRRRSSRSSSRSYSRRRSSSSRSSYSSSSSRSSRSRSRSRSRNRQNSRRSNPNHASSSTINGKGRGAMVRRGRGARNGPRSRRAGSNENSHASAQNRNGFKYNATAANAARKLPGNKSTRILTRSVPQSLNTEDPPAEPITTFPAPSPSMISTTIVSPTSTNILTMTNEEVKAEPIILTTNQNVTRPGNQRKNGKGKVKQQTPAYSMKKDDNVDMDQGDDEPIIGPKLPPEYEKRVTKEHSFTPPDLDDPENREMLKDLKYRAEIHAAKNHGLISESEAQQLIDQHETQKQLAELPIISMPILPSQTISPMGPFLLAAPTPTIATYQLPMTTAAVAAAAVANGSTLTSSPDHNSLTTLEQQQSQLQQQQEQQLSPNSAASNNADPNTNSGHTTPCNTTVVTPDGQTMMIQTPTNMNPQLVQIQQQNQPLYMPMQTAVQQPRVVAIRTAQGTIQHFLEYPTAQLLQAQQAQQQTQYIQHNGQLVPVIRPQLGYSSAALMQQIQIQQHQALAAQLQAQQLAAMQQQGGAIFLQNSAGQLVFAQPNPQAMRVVQLPYMPK